ncbi:hypothetical protein [Pseudolactococcus reticulitermitis]|uniref:WxL domain-containing protein n=1 Tax=Pseudolactococcus reticulitermitis TaxID=2025039 RepID=A0A224X8E1_9LACT|nr:hypothetical protein [Lactococcus reticulitermitis]GAX46504.1 hypothetical protein RsY01_83 [Lactococcus reticulitermitis]
MKKMIQMLLTSVILIGFFSMIVGADERASPIQSSVEPTDGIQKDLKENITARASYAGDGTENNPYQVSNISDLKSALKANAASGNTLYIQLTADIAYTDSDLTIAVSKNTVLDGANHYILYKAPSSWPSYDASHFVTAANNLNITFKNLKYGNATYPNSSYYGILRVLNSNINFVLENIDYNTVKGSQPFWGNSNPSNTLTFKGTNSFRTDGDVDGGEFVEGFTTLNFADDSKTTVYNDSTNSDAVFWCAKQKVNIGKNATLEITTSKEYLFYNDDDVTINVQEKGQFTCKFIKGKNYTASKAELRSDGSWGNGTITMNFAKDSIGCFRTEKDAFTGTSRNYPTINATSPNYILFEATPTNKSVISGITPKFVRKDTDGYNYPIDYLTTSGQKHFVTNVSGTQNVSASNIQNGYSLVYARASQMTGLAATPKVGVDLSEIDAQVKKGASSSFSSGRVSYKLAKNKLYSGNDVTLGEAQNSIDKATSAEGVLESPVINITSDVSKESTYVFQNLLAQTYYLYSKIGEQRASASGYIFDSPWVEEVVAVQPLIAVTLPDSIDFTSSLAGEFGKSNNLQNYVAVNHGNVPVNVDLKTIASNTGCSPDVSLVDQFDNETEKLVLKLTAENTASGEDVTWSPLLEGKPIPSNPIKLDPFWETSHQASLYVNGKQSVPLGAGLKAVSYKLAVEVKQVTR